ncbi:unnamed protein product [Brachionus calyciflorus]|uniref:Uncharacterized protein n=1 Tax=Brachionus calyciflorus TaxID=104777 RepID=A0A814BNW8_9BILA|nr:unnamed protein product [Brachionus calyciflorus]
MYPCGTNIKEEKLCADDLMDDLSALEINEEDFDFSQENDAEIEPLQDGNIDELDTPILEIIEAFPVIDEPTVAPAIPAINEPPEAQNIPDMVHGVIPLNKLDTQSFIAAIDMIIFQMEKGFKNIEFIKSGTRYVVVSITITKIRVEIEPKSDLANELKTLSQIECPRAENVAKILTEDENTNKGKRGRPPKENILGKFLINDAILLNQKQMLKDKEISVDTYVKYAIQAFDFSKLEAKLKDNCDEISEAESISDDSDEI